MIGSVRLSTISPKNAMKHQTPGNTSTHNTYLHLLFTHHTGDKAVKGSLHCDTYTRSRTVLQPSQTRISSGHQIMLNVKSSTPASLTGENYYAAVMLVGLGGTCTPLVRSTPFSSHHKSLFALLTWIQPRVCMLQYVPSFTPKLKLYCHPRDVSLIV